MKNIVDTMAVVGAPLSDDKIVDYIIIGLAPPSTPLLHHSP
jgi:hypothetical protein